MVPEILNDLIIVRGEAGGDGSGGVREMVKEWGRHYCCDGVRGSIARITGLGWRLERRCRKGAAEHYKERPDRVQEDLLRER